MEMEDMSLEVAEKDTAAEIAAEAAIADPANRPAKRSSNTRVRLEMAPFPLQIRPRAGFADATNLLTLFLPRPPQRPASPAVCARSNVCSATARRAPTVSASALPARLPIRHHRAMATAPPPSPCPAGASAWPA
jgi:hypothetical protein